MPDHPNRLLRDLLDLIDRYGWAVRHVAAGDGRPPFSYTIGLTALDHPEMVMVGMPREPAHAFLNLAGDAIKAGRTFQHGEITDALTDGAGIGIITVVAAEELTAVAQVYGVPVQALQLIWPDSKGWLPWEPGYNNAAETQPFLGPLPTAWRRTH
ncbi:DUF4262 domain-containing protein [Rudaeicoccus suwonensis]|uniref:DUF4262 domain-containing protein n=1 Tax=Rudaeicoccus suwonensis TaxID=657409 RepID=UPI0014772682|nr:DUF4262 domain-containing protein [Rudaeicoccus suwonensis]